MRRRERQVALHVEAPATAKQPKIVSLTAEAITPDGYAPATYKISADTENAPLCLWDWGDARPLVVVNEATKHLERLVTFDKPRDYHVTLTAVNDTVAVSQTTVVHLKSPRRRRERRPDRRRRRHGGSHARPAVHAQRHVPARRQGRRFAPERPGIVGGGLQRQAQGMGHPRRGADRGQRQTGEPGRQIGNVPRRRCAGLPKCPQPPSRSGTGPAFDASGRGIGARPDRAGSLRRRRPSSSRER